MKENILQISLQRHSFMYNEVTGEMQEFFVLFLAFTQYKIENTIADYCLTKFYIP